MYKLAKYFEEVVDESKVIERIELAISELNENMISYEGTFVLNTLVSAGENSCKEFLELVKAPQGEIEDAQENDYIEDLAREYFDTLTEDLTTMCKENDLDLGRFNFYISFNENDGDIDLFLNYLDWEDVSDLDEDEYEKRLALAEHFDCEVTDIIDLDEDGRYQIGGIEYLILDDDTANEKVKAEIEEYLWAFKPSFLAGETNLSQVIFDAIMDNGKCESNNDAIRELIEATCGMDEFVDSAIDEDGRGQYLNRYDGEEDEIDVDGETLYAYRID